MAKVQEAASQGLELANQGLEIANRNIAAVQEQAVALVPTEGLGGDLVVKAKDAGGLLMRIGKQCESRVDNGVRVIRNVRSFSIGANESAPLNT
jgi:hypothetical protein